FDALIADKGYVNRSEAVRDLGATVGDIVSASLAGNRDITLLERSRLTEVARQQRLAMSGVVETSTAAKAGKLVGARYFILGAVSRFGALLVATARLVDVESGRVLASFERTSKQGEDETTLVSRNLASDILAFISGDAPAPGDPTSDYKYYLYEALGYYNLGEYRKSLPFWEKMTQLSPRNGLLRFIVAGLHFQTKRYSDALLAAQQAVTWEPSFAEAHLLVGKAYFLLGDNHKATPPLDKALELDPRLVEALFLKGSAFKNRKRVEEAADYFLEAIQIDKTYIPAYLALGQLLLENGAADEAAGILLSGLQQQPNNGNLRFLLGAAQIMRGNLQGAKEQISALKTIDAALAKKLEELLQNNNRRKGRGEHEKSLLFLGDSCA
ncbi:MAG: hypothetical protein CVV55_07050, partial [Synergistetes bacterium HGW-Synergistetes-2]